MHGLLALSALHMAHIHPESKRQYTSQSARHQDIALSRLRNGLFDISEHNIHERFLLAYLVMIFTYYSIGNPLEADHRLTTQELGQSLFLGQGIMSMISVPNNWNWMKSGPLGIVINNAPRITGVTPIGKFADRIDQIVSQLIMPLAGSPEMSHARASCMVGADALKRAYNSLLKCGREDSAAIWAWPATLPSDFRDYVCSNHPVALIIVGHYAALVQCMDDRWHLSGWSQRTFLALEEALDEDRRGWLEFARAFKAEDLDAAVKEYEERESKASSS